MNVQAYVESGNLEKYCFELYDDVFAQEVATLSLVHPSIKQELNKIEQTIEQLAQMHAVAPDSKLRKRVLTAISLSPEVLDINNLPPTSKYADYNAWLNAVEHLIPAEPFDDFFAHLLREDKHMAQTLVITKMNVPEEIHEEVAESFFILKGTCVCTVGNETYTLNAGDHLDIPLHVNHDIKIISPYVIAILQHQFA
jgi:mannose-6-phosphate isomerase-like protein (cupin superfamily)